MEYEYDFDPLELRPAGSFSYNKEVRKTIWEEDRYERYKDRGILYLELFGSWMTLLGYMIVIYILKNKADIFLLQWKKIIKTSMIDSLLFLLTKAAFCKVIVFLSHFGGWNNKRGKLAVFSLTWIYLFIVFGTKSSINLYDSPATWIN